MKYELKTWKLTVSGEYDSDLEAIKKLGDAYLRMSKCDRPGESVPELLGSITRLRDPAKHVFLFVQYEVFGIIQMVQKFALHIYPSCKDHWWDSEGLDIPTTPFRFCILDQDGNPLPENIL